MMRWEDMSHNQGQDFRRSKGRSEAQRQWNAAVGAASRLFEDLSDEQRLGWNTEGKTRRTTGQRYFVKINAHRLWNGHEALMELPKPEPTNTKRVLRRFVITNRQGRIKLKLELSYVPTMVLTVWASRPCNRGLSVCDKCPRLGPLPAPKHGLSDITALYFQKHGEYIRKQGVPLFGKRIFICLRQESGDGLNLCQAANAVVPAPPGWQRPP